MNDLNATINLQEYINKLHEKGCFVIPDYQRGYVWGRKKKDVKVDSVTFLIRTLVNAFKGSKDVFLQGITVHIEKDSDDIFIVDGQQRTTFFYLLLKYLEYGGYINIRYEIRKESNQFLKGLNVSGSDVSENDDEEYQDIFFFKRTLRIFKEELETFDKHEFREFILKHVKFLYVVIPAGQATIVFTMMNGNKAIMREEELIKAELLRCASLKSEYIEEAEHSQMRGRLAREWDKWLYWWNKKEVEQFFRTEGRQLGWLLPLVCKSQKISFDDFRNDNELLKEQSIKQSKAIFKKMRLLQKSIEDVFYDSQLCNYMGMILYIRNSTEERFSFLRWFFSIDTTIEHPKSRDELKRYYDWSIIGVSHKDIVAKKEEAYIEGRNRFRSELEDNLLYRNFYETAYRWLIRQNIKEDNKFDGRKFNFDIERNRSIEHIYPKSKVGHKGDEGVELDWKDEKLDESKMNIKLWREDIKWKSPDGQDIVGSEHCIGNLVLLYKRDNSKFNDADFSAKNRFFFTDLDDDAFKSRHLIHTTMVFSDVEWNENDGWNKEKIAKRKHSELAEFDKEYPDNN